MTKKFTVLAGMPRLYKGESEDPADGACIMQYVSLIRGGVAAERFTDAPRCTVSPVRNMAIGVNDFSADEVREERLMPMVHRLLNAHGLTSAQRSKLARWEHKAHEEAQNAAELYEQLNRHPLGKESVARYSGHAAYCECEPSRCRIAKWNAGRDEVRAQVFLKWLNIMLDQIEAWKHAKPTPVTVEAWLQYEQLREQRVGS